MDEEYFNLSITSESGFSFTKKISKFLCDEIVILATRGISPSEKPAEPKIAPVSRTPSIGNVSMGLNEFCQSYKVKNNKERIAATAYYLELVDGSKLMRKDVPALFVKAGYSRPKNPNRDLRETVTVGWISTPTESDDEFYPTTKGKDYLESKKSG